MFDEVAPGLQLLDDIDACPYQSVRPLDIPRRLGVCARDTVLRAVQRGPQHVNMARLVEALIIQLGNAEAKRRGVFVVQIHIDTRPASSSKGLGYALGARTDIEQSHV